jgi:hypothetical protein
MKRDRNSSKPAAVFIAVLGAFAVLAPSAEAVVQTSTTALAAPTVTTPVRPNGPFVFGYLPPGYAVGPVEQPATYDDVQSSYLYESNTHDRWAVSVSGISSPDGRYCTAIPKALRPTISTDRLARAVAAGGISEPRTGKVAMLRGGVAVTSWFFDDRSIVNVRPPSLGPLVHVSALISCSTGATIVASGRLTKTDLVRLFADPTGRGALTMTDYASALNPNISEQMLLTTNGSIRVVLATDPRTDRGMAIAGPNPARVHGHPALVDRESAALSISWIERPGKRVTVESTTSSLAELVKVGDGIAIA